MPIERITDGIVISSELRKKCHRLSPFEPDDSTAR